MTWETGAPPAAAPAGQVTGSSVTKAEPASTDAEWTIDELKAGKPKLVYFFVQGMDQSNSPGDDSYKFSAAFEMGCLGEKVVEQLNEGWSKVKVGLDFEADRKLAKNQARIEFYSFTKQRMGDITVKEKSLLSQSAFRAILRKYEAKNAEICAKEIKRIEAQQKAVEDAKTAAK